MPVVLALLVLAVRGPWRVGREAWYVVAFGAAAFVVVLLTPLVAGLPPLHGLPRYALEFLPIYLVLSRLGADRGALRTYLGMAIPPQAILLVAFFLGSWLS